MPAIRPIRKVRAAGGIVVRPARKGPKVLLVHRPRYDDWGFPKGKVDPGETWKDAALREVEEETGFRCKLHKPRLASLQYYDGSGRIKEVRYWIMTIKKGEFTPNDEVDEIAWVRLEKVESKLSYSRERRLFRAVLRSRGINSVV